MEWLAVGILTFLELVSLFGAFEGGRRYERWADKKMWFSMMADQCDDCEHIGYKQGYQEGLKAALAEQDEANRR